jgi:hypothetical protein
MMSSKAQPKASKLEPALLEASDKSALSALTQAGSLAVELVEAWIKAGNAGAVNEVAEHGSGPARKAARRGLNVLKARGIAIPETKRVASLAGTRAEETLEAFLLAPDSLGNILLTITARTPTSRARTAFVYLNDSTGILRVNVGELSQSQLKEAMASALPGAQYRPVKVPVEWARQRIAQARKRHGERGIPEPLGVTSAQSLLEPVPSAAQEHPFDTEGLELSEDDAKDFANNSAALHLLPEFQGWFPPKTALDELLYKVGEALAASGVEPGGETPADLMKEKLDAEILSSTDRYFSPERRSDLTRAMKDSALSVLSREGEVRALEIVGTMKMIDQAGLITNPPHEIPFLRVLFEKGISALAMQGGGRLRIPIPPSAAAAEAAPGV